jgi:hypothetical protein
MKMLIFTLLAKLKHITESIKTQIWWWSGIQSINCPDSGYSLEQYMNSNTICCTKPGLQTYGDSEEENLQKKYTTKRPCKIKMYILSTQRL